MHVISPIHSKKTQMGTAQLSTPWFVMVSFDLVREMLYIYLTLILLTWRIWWAPNNVSRWQMGFNSAFKGLNYVTTSTSIRQNRAFSIVNGHKVDKQVLIPGRGRDHSLHQWVQINPGAHPVSCVEGSRGYFVIGRTKYDWTLLVCIPDTEF
jgi:hypothetical protein